MGDPPRAEDVLHRFGHHRLPMTHTFRGLNSSPQRVMTSVRWDVHVLSLAAPRNHMGISAVDNGGRLVSYVQLEVFTFPAHRWGHTLVMPIVGNPYVFAVRNFNSGEIQIHGRYWYYSVRR